jgi:hypothetical protein
MSTTLVRFYIWLSWQCYENGTNRERYKSRQESSLYVHIEWSFYIENEVNASIEQRFSNCGTDHLPEVQAILLLGLIYLRYNRNSTRDYMKSRAILPTNSTKFRFVKRHWAVRNTSRISTEELHILGYFVNITLKNVMKMVVSIRLLYLFQKISDIITKEVQI